MLAARDIESLSVNEIIGRLACARSLDAFAWLGRAARPEDVCLAGYLDGNRIGRFVGVHVVLGHYSVTPDAQSTEGALERLLRGTLDDEAARRLLSGWRVRWVYFSPRAYPEARPERWGCESRYRERGVAIYECGASQAIPNAGGSRGGGAEGAAGSAPGVAERQPCRSGTG